MRRYRKQRRQGLRSVRILLDETDIDALIRMKLCEMRRLSCATFYNPTESLN